MNDEAFMRHALAMAERALAEGAMPIGAALVCDGEVIAEAHWRQDGDRGLLGHPEHLVLMAADHSIEFAGRRATTLYTTLEPCLMCMGTAMSFFLGRIVYAMAAPADGAAVVADVWSPRLGHPTTSGAYSVPAIDGGVCAEEARALIVAWLESGAAGPEAEFARQLL